MMNESLNIAIVGATGYVGLELVNILSRHPKVKISYLCAQKNIGKSINSFDKRIKKKNLPKISKIENINWEKIKILFTALPNGEAQRLATYIPKKIKIIDLSADFRLNSSESYKRWYGKNHRCKDLIKKSIYAITEFKKKSIKDYRIISCPGCYPTSIQLPLIPLIQTNLIKNKNIIIDSKSGYSGAGKNIKKKFTFKNLFNSVSAYGLGFHRHVGEIEQELSKASQKKINIFFTPHILPMFRGILSTIYLEPNKNVNAYKVYKFLKKYHKGNFFIRLAKFNSKIGTGEVMNTNFCKISVCESRNKDKIIILSVIDNLIKGASGQAVQNMNVSYNLKESTGLI